MTARKKGVPNHSIVAWVKRKVSCIHITRMRKDGGLGCSVPCILCKQLILKFDLRVICHTAEGDVYDGKMDAEDAPVSKFTSGQKRKLGSKLAPHTPLPRYLDILKYYFQGGTVKTCKPP